MNQPYLLERTLVTPEIAKDMLSKNMPNRGIISMQVARLAKAMTLGEFKDGDPIKFDKNGMLIDGQHRLSAVIKSGIPTYFLIICGYEPESASVIDIGKPRNASHIAKIQGDEHINAGILSALRGMMLVSTFETNPLGTSKQVDSFTKHQIIEIAKVYYESIVFAQKYFGSSRDRIKSMCIPAIVARAYCGGADPERLNEFLQVIHTGMPKSKEDTAAQKLREMFLTKNFPFQGKGLQVAQLQYTQSGLLFFLKRVERSYKLTPSSKNLFPVPQLDILLKNN